MIQSSHDKLKLKGGKMSFQDNMYYSRYLTRVNSTLSVTRISSKI